MEFEEGEYLVSFNDEMMRKVYLMTIENKNIKYPYIYDAIFAALKTAKRID